MQGSGNNGTHVPHLSWDRRHNVARITVSFTGRIWHRREVGNDVVLGYNATGRLARVVLLDPAALLPEDADEHRALEIVTATLLRRAGVRQADLDVLVSALDRAL